MAIVKVFNFQKIIYFTFNHIAYFLEEQPSLNVSDNNTHTILIETVWLSYCLMAVNKQTRNLDSDYKATFIFDLMYDNIVKKCK